MIDYDFEKQKSFGNGNAMITTAMPLHKSVNEFLGSNLNAVILNLCFGLDTWVNSSREMKDW